MVDILGWIIDPILSFIRSRICSKEELKQKHLDDIKKEVLKPMFDSLTCEVIPGDYYAGDALRAGYMRILKGNAPLIYPKRKQVFVKGLKATEDPVRFKDELAILKPELGINENLYLDIKQNHYKGLAQDWGEFISEFERYANNWLAYAENIREIVEKELDLPIYSGNLDGYCINASSLAAYVIEKIMGLNSIPVRIEDANKTLMIALRTQQNYQIAVMGPPEKIQKCVELINNLIENDTKAEELNKPVKKLLEKAKHLQTEIDKVIKSYNLPGRCEFI